MTDERMALLAPVEKQVDGNLLREMLAFAAERIMEAEGVVPETAPPVWQRYGIVWLRRGARPPLGASPRLGARAPSASSST